MTAGIVVGQISVDRSPAFEQAVQRGEVGRLRQRLKPDPKYFVNGVKRINLKFVIGAVPQDEHLELTVCADAAVSGGFISEDIRFFEPDGIKKHVMKKGEIITHIELPREAANLRATYQKLRLRDSFDYPVLGVAGSLARQNRVIEELRIVVNAISWIPLEFGEVTEDQASFVARRFA